MRIPLVYKDKPVFGFDIGSRTIKVVQLKHSGHGPKVVGYGHANFPADTIVEGIISDPKAMADVARKLLEHPDAGRITARRAVVSLPASKLFIRMLQLPPMAPADLDQAVHLETEQYVPVPLQDLYLDYEVVDRQATKEDPHIDVLMVAAPRAIVDSYMKLFEYLDMEIAVAETSLAAITRALTADRTKTSTLLIDMGSVSTDFTVYDRVVRLTGTISVGGDHFTEGLVAKLGITRDQANEIKYKFGIAQSGLRAKVVEALTPQLVKVADEAKKVLKFYTQRSESHKTVEQIILAGGSASMPGLPQFLERYIGIPIQIGDPWAGLVLGPLKKVDKINQPIYTTAIGLARMEVQRHG